MAEPCPLCNGSGWIRSETPSDLGSYYDKRCRCKKREAIIRHLGPEIAGAKVIPETPLLVVKDGKLETDLTTKNLYIESSWETLLPHLRKTLGMKGVEFYFRVVNDEMVKSVYLKERTAKMRLTAGSDGEVFNSMDDLMGESVDLVIVRFGFLAWKKSEAPAGIMLEALNIRKFCRRPTWIVSDPNSDHSFERSLSYSSTLQAYFDQDFKKVSFESSSLGDDVTEDMDEFIDAHESADAKPTPQPEPEPQPVVSSSGSFEGPGKSSGERKPKYKNKGYPSKKREKLPEDL